MSVWVETSKKHGQRLCKQTLNPKTKKWNNPKKGTYQPIIVLEKEVQSDGRVFVKDKSILVRSDTTIDDIKNWGEKYSLDDYQEETMKRLMVGVNARKYIKYTVKESEPIDPFNDSNAKEKLQKLSEENKTAKQREDEILEQAINLSYRELRNKDKIDKI